MTRNLFQFTGDNDGIISVLASDGALFVCSLVSRYGYIQTQEFKTEFEADANELQLVLLDLIEAGFIIYHKRESGVFNGWVLSEKGHRLLHDVGIPTNARFSVPGETVDDIASSLEAQLRHGANAPPLDAVLAIVAAVPTDRQEWLAFAICFEPLGTNDLPSLLSPSDSDALRLRSQSIAELECVVVSSPDEKWTKSKPVVSQREWQQLKT